MQACLGLATLVLNCAIQEETLALLWFIVWLVANVIGDHEPCWSTL